MLLISKDIAEQWGAEWESAGVFEVIAKFRPRGKQGEAWRCRAVCVPPKAEAATRRGGAVLNSGEEKIIAGGVNWGPHLGMLKCRF